MLICTQNLVGETHLLRQTQKFMIDIDAAVQRALSAASADLNREKVDQFSHFWAAGIVEFHLFFIQPLLSITACNQGSVRRVESLDWRTLTGNGINLIGVHSDRKPVRDVTLRVSQLGASIARWIYGFKDLKKDLSLEDEGPKFRYAAFVASRFYLESLKLMFGRDAIFLTHEPALLEVMEREFSSDQWLRILGESSMHPHSSIPHQVSKFLKREFAKVSLKCLEDGTEISSAALWDAWQNFVSTRWVAYLGFKRSAEIYASFLKKRGVKLAVFGQDRNMRERVWCKVLRSHEIRSSVVEFCLYDPDPSFAYRLEADSLLVDSKFTASAIQSLGHSRESVVGVGHPGATLLYKRRLSQGERADRKLKLGLPSDARLFLFGTQNVADGSSGTNKVTSESLSDIKTRELRFMAEMAKVYGFQVVLKPHPKESADFYKERLEPGDPIQVLPSSYSSQELLTFVDAVVTRWSTLSYEAMASGIPVFFLNFYHHQPKLACFEEPEILVARAPEQAEAQFRHFWERAFTPKYQKFVLDWANAQGWGPGVEERIRKQLDQML